MFAQATVNVKIGFKNSCLPFFTLQRRILIQRDIKSHTRRFGFNRPHAVDGRGNLIIFSARLPAVRTTRYPDSHNLDGSHSQLSSIFNSHSRSTHLQSIHSPTAHFMLIKYGSESWTESVFNRVRNAHGKPHSQEKPRKLIIYV